jgi:phage/plasmid-like protein (TIGR03299 family)
MSAETEEWLNQNILIGFTAKRGNAWHYRASAQGAESNHYEGAIPTEDVVRRLFDWDFLIGDISSTVVHADGVTVVSSTDRQAIIRPAGVLGGEHAEPEILGIFKTGYRVHPYKETLVENLSTIIDDSDLAIGSAGLLRRGGVGFVQIELPDTIETPEGMSFRPYLMSSTSVDGTMATTYSRGAVVGVCDNTVTMVNADAAASGLQIKYRHSVNSLPRVQDARDALQIVHSTADEFAQQIAQLAATTVTDAQWAAFLDAHNPIPPVKPGARGTRSNTMATNRRDELSNLWDNDNRVSPWRNTALGVLQAVNTHAQHVQSVKGATRADRNALATIEGRFAKMDNDTMATLSKVLAFSS